MKTDAELRDGLKVFPEMTEKIIMVTFFRNEEDPEDNVRATELVIEDIKK